MCVSGGITHCAHSSTFSVIGCELTWKRFKVDNYQPHIDGELTDFTSYSKLRDETDYRLEFNTFPEFETKYANVDCVPGDTSIKCRVTLCSAVFSGLVQA